mmetsp:Transcript_3614/g.4223  ORF Transcript_3614/g.4223 Transcript_3614/m.4223 type:complete len:135 (-) Transcript_3614:104-508(-)
MNGMVKWSIRDIKKQLQEEKLKYSKMGSLEQFINPTEFNEEFKEKTDQILGGVKGKKKSKFLKGIRKSMPDLRVKAKIQADLDIHDALDRINRVMRAPNEFETLEIETTDDKHLHTLKNLSKNLYIRTRERFAK